MQIVIHRDSRIVVHEHGEVARELDKRDPLALPPNAALPSREKGAE